MATITGMELGAKLRAWLDAVGWSDRELARRMDVSPTTVGNLIAGTDPRRRDLMRLVKITGLPLTYWADDDLDEPPSSAVGPDEQFLLRAVRAMGLGPDEAIRLIRLGIDAEKSADFKPRVLGGGAVLQVPASRYPESVESPAGADDPPRRRK